MLRNVLIAALRSMRRRRGYTAINVVGLSTGLACCLLIALFVRDELSYDRFHPAADRLYRVSREIEFSGRIFKTLDVPGNMTDEVARTQPGVEAIARMNPAALMPLRVDRGTFFDENVAWAEGGLFTLFGLPIERGDPALDRPGTAAVSATRARQLFGEGVDPVGRVVRVGADETPVEIAAVFGDLPHNTHLRFDLVRSIAAQELSGDSWWTYVRLAPGADPATVEAAFGSAFERAGRSAGIFRLVPVTDIYLSGRAVAVPAGAVRGSERLLWVFSAVALFVLLIACVNYVNLATARAAGRAREIGVRRAAGAGRGQLFSQFMGESVLFALLCAAAGVLLARLVLPAFNAMTGKALTVTLFGAGSVLPWIVLGAVVVGLAAGAWPALALSSMRPATILRGDTRGGGSARLRGVLVVFQLAVSIVLIVFSLGMRSQMRFVQSASPGFDSESLLVLQPEGALTANQEAFLAEVRRAPGVEAAAFGQIPGQSFLSIAHPDGSTDDDGVTIAIAAIDFDFVPTVGLEVVAGRNLSPDHPADASGGALLNETAVREFGWTPAEAIGRTFALASMERHVVGVTRDHHFQSLKAAIMPLMMDLEGGNGYRSLPVRFRPDDLRETMSALQATWQRFIHDRPFTARFLDEAMDEAYRTDQAWQRLMATASAISIVIAALGLLGLVTLVVSDRMREIGIRKVLGATAAQATLLLTRGYVLLVAVALAVAAPVAWMLLSKWLDAFAYRVSIGPGVFLLAGGLVFVVAVSTAGLLALRAALQDPVKSLRNE